MAGEMVRYSQEHYWISRCEQAVVRIGVTYYYLDQLAAIRIVDLPPVGQQLIKGDTMVTLESSKAAIDLPSPLSGCITRVNESVTADPSILNCDPAGEGWLVEMRLDDERDFDELLSEGDYQQLILG